jgi:hypothetical protein
MFNQKVLKAGILALFTTVLFSVTRYSCATETQISYIHSYPLPKASRAISNFCNIPEIKIKPKHLEQLLNEEVLNNTNPLLNIESASEEDMEDPVNIPTHIRWDYSLPLKRILNLYFDTSLSDAIKDTERGDIEPLKNLLSKGADPMVPVQLHYNTLRHEQDYSDHLVLSAQYPNAMAMLLEYIGQGYSECMLDKAMFATYDYYHENYNTFKDDIIEALIFDNMRKLCDLGATVNRRAYPWGVSGIGQSVTGSVRGLPLFTDGFRKRMKDIITYCEKKRQERKRDSSQ